MGNMGQRDIVSGGHQAACGTPVSEAYSGSITQGNSPGVAVGYSTAFSIGAISPTTHNGHTIADWYDQASGSTGVLRISGFSSDPGKNWIVSCTAHGTTKTAASSTYSYSLGAAQWSWPAGAFGFATSGTTAATIK
jgi:hypothetical protein